MNESVKLKLLAGVPLIVEDIVIKPLTLYEIAEIGYENYNSYLMNLVADVSDFKIPNVDLTNYDYYDILVNNMLYGDENYRSFIYEALRIFLKEDYLFNCETLVFESKLHIIDRNKFNNIKNVLMSQNCVEKKEKLKMANSHAEQILQKMLKGRQQIGGNNTINFDDLVSTLAANQTGLNIKTIWELTMFQFNNQFSRMQMIEDYDINIRQLLAGAKKEDIQLRHYINPILKTNKEIL